MGKLSTTRLAFLAVAVAAAFPVLAQAADAATVDQGTLEKGFSQSTGGNSIFEDTNVALKLNNQVTVGTSLDTKAKIYLKGETDNISSLSIKSNSIHFGSNAEITASGSTINPGEGLNHFSAWQDGNSSLTIETNKLTIGDNEKSADRGFQMKGANNHLTILADEIVAYVGDGFINAQGTDGSSKVLIGTETNRIKQFEAHTTYGKDDYGVALLQANEGNTVSLYADEAILDGSRGPEGGVIGSGGWGTVIVDANKLTIDGNICGTYGKMSNAGKKLTEWEGTDGKLEASDSVKVDVNGAVQTASTTLNGTSTLTLNDGAKITSDKLDGSGGTFLINTADKQIINIDNYENTNAQAVLSGSQNDKYASADDAVNALKASVGSTKDLSLSAAEGAVADSWKVVVNDDGSSSVITQANQKLEGYNTINSLAVFSWRHELNNLQKRMGELRDLNGNIGAWTRVFGSEQKYGDAGQVNKNTTIQVGADVKVADAWTIGGAFSYTDGSVEATGISGDNKAYAFTAYGVWQHENGSYLDLTARYARLDADFTAQTMTGSYNNNAYAVTAEVGHKFNLSELAFIEPQAEVIYGRVVGDDFTASNGTRFSQKDYDSLIGRLGARAGFNFPENKGNIYARFSVVHDFQGEVETTAFNNTSRTVKDDLGGTWVEYGVGGNFRLSDTANVYVDFERTSGGEIQENWRWTIGARKVF